MDLPNHAEKENDQLIALANEINLENIGNQTAPKKSRSRGYTDAKKKRTKTSPYQLEVLQSTFETDPMPSTGIRAALALHLGMTSRSVQVWFQNRRAKGKHDRHKRHSDSANYLSFFADQVQSNSQESAPSSLSTLQFYQSHSPCYDLNTTPEEYKSYLLKNSEFFVQEFRYHHETGDIDARNINPVDRKRPKKYDAMDFSLPMNNSKNLPYPAPFDMERELRYTEGKALDFDANKWCDPSIYFEKAYRTASEVGYPNHANSKAAYLRQYPQSDQQLDDCHYCDNYHQNCQCQENYNPHSQHYAYQPQENRLISPPISPPQPNHAFIKINN
ncbi:hypothetical protein MDAP_000872 [Mitosporidium daphniae]|uniref:Homeobox transcription factor n=1 Tax=Mitosporidium daphniae TaxID=1485682 RepID=A0A098VSB4_9MICR|nr:homeobox transcription factor [Mitosporidium daphniae]KGG51714.1 homeobox transcription factor [Mitosporidium daphniae]|eukprot:XP_013238150.1 homeobox transcription factor [Mitosporidium daphniae]